MRPWSRDPVPGLVDKEMAASLIFKDPCLCCLPMRLHRSFFGAGTLPLYRYGPCADGLFFFLKIPLPR